MGNEAGAPDPTVSFRRWRFALLAPGLAGSSPRSSIAVANSLARVKVLSDTHVASASGGSIRAGEERVSTWRKVKVAQLRGTGRQNTTRGAHSISPSQVLTCTPTCELVQAGDGTGYFLDSFQSEKMNPGKGGAK